VLILLAAIFFAYLLSPAVGFVDRMARRRLSRILTLAVVYTLLIGVLVSLVTAIGLRVSREAAALVNSMPDLAKTAGKLSSAPLPPWLEPVRGQIFDLIQGQLEGGVERAMPMLRAGIGQLLTAIGNLGFALLVPFLSFFFLKDAEQLRAMLLEVLGQTKNKAFVDSLLDDLHVMLGRYIRALFFLSVATFTVYAIFFQATGAPYAALLATIGGLLEVIPVIGPLAAAGTALIVALMSGYPHLVWMIVFFIAYRLFLDFVLQPHLLGAGVALHPLLVVFGALAGEQVAGIAGMVLSVPVLAALRLIYVRTTRRA
jgi:predicted PurR-regulated permease PerM